MVTPSATGAPTVRVPPCGTSGIASCSDPELYDHLFHYCRLLTMLEYGGLRAADARLAVVGVISPLWAEAERRGLPLHRLPGDYRATCAARLPVN